MQARRQECNFLSSACSSTTALTRRFKVKKLFLFLRPCFTSTSCALQTSIWDVYSLVACLLISLSNHLSSFSCSTLSLLVEALLSISMNTFLRPLWEVHVSTAFARSTSASGMFASPLLTTACENQPALVCAFHYCIALITQEAILISHCISQESYRCSQLNYICICSMLAVEFNTNVLSGILTWNAQLPSPGTSTIMRPCFPKMSLRGGVSLGLESQIWTSSPTHALIVRCDTVPTLSSARKRW